MLTFAYACPVKYGNPMGHRIMKKVSTPTQTHTTLYSRDAQGNTMAVYDNSYYKSDWVACEIDRATYQEIYNRLQQIKEEAMQSEEPNHYQNLLEQYIRNRWQEDSCRYKYIQKLGAMSLPCMLPSEYYSFIQQLYYQDVEYVNSLGEEEKRAYFRTKYNEYYGQMGEYTLCFTQELEKAFTQPQETFEDWYQAQQNTPFEEKVEPFFAEFQQIPINYGTITDTAYQDSLYWKEQHLYGSSRLGIAKPELEVTNHTPSNASTLTTNFKNYELTNHLGNVLATIKDEKQQIDQNADGIVDYYEPIVITANDYYPFGMVMPNRSFSLAGSNYRFGFNGKEDDREIDGQQDYGFRIYDFRLVRFKSIDPLTNKYPELTPYQFASNTPIQAIDLDGLEMFLVNGYDGYSSRTKDASKADDLAKMKSYWINNNPNFIKQASTRFNEKDIRFLDGSQGGLSHGSVNERFKAGYKMAIKLINDKKINFSEPITLISHSMGGAYATGMSSALLKSNPNAVINHLLLAPDGAEQFKTDQRVNSAQFTYSDDGVVTSNGAIVKNVDVNLNPNRAEFQPYKSKSISKAMEAHSAPIDDKATSNFMLNNPETEKVFKTKKK